MIRRDDTSGRYELLDGDDVVGFAAFTHVDADTISVPHTEVVPSRRGEGLGAQLVEGMLDDLARRGQRIVPLCPFVVEFIEKHPDYADLVA